MRLVFDDGHNTGLYTWAVLYELCASTTASGAATSSGSRKRARFAAFRPRAEPAVTATLYGIRNCDTMKKARAWLDVHGVRYVFHDYKTAGVDASKLEAWSREVGWEALLNRAGTTFRNLGDADKQKVDEGKALRLMAVNPSVIKRPVLESGPRLLVGFNPEVYERELGLR